MPHNPDSGRNILVINHDAGILQLFDDLLSEAGYRVTQVKFDRQTAGLMDVLRRNQPDLVVMDLVIGDEPNGWQLLHASRMDRTTRDIPVVICTGALTQVTEMSAELESLGVNVVLKPFDIDHLLEVIDKVWRSQAASTPTPLQVEAYESQENSDS